MKSLKLSDYFEIIDPKYICLKLTPVKSLRNYNSDKIISTISTLYQALTQRIMRENKKIFVTRQIKISYYIYMEKNRIEFYFVIPEQYESLLKGKISDTWQSITIEKVDSLPSVGDSPIRYYLTLKKEDALSLSTDRRNNSLLSGLLNTVDILEQGERCAVMFNFSPVSQSSWRSQCIDTIKKYADGMPMDRQKAGMSFLIKMMFRIMFEVMGILMETVTDIMGSKMPEPPKHIPQELAAETYKKKDARIVNAQIIVFSNGDNKPRSTSNAVSLCGAFQSINSDNELVYHRCFNQPDTFKASPLECQNFLSLPGKELIEEHNINCIDVLESQVPAELQAGTICIGTNTYHGHEQKAYLSMDRDLQYLSLVLIGPTRAGKTTLIRNITQDAVWTGECTIIFDFCKNCELSDEICSNVADHLIIDCADPDRMQGMGYNEVTSIKSKNVFTRYANAKMVAMQLMVLIDSVSTGRNDMSVRMNRYLESAAVVVFMNGGSIYRVIECLSNSTVRAQEISKLPAEQSQNMEKHVNNLHELDDEKGGTKNQLITGIMDRIDKLQQNVYMETMLEKSIDGNINLMDEMEKSQAICIKIPDIMFPSQTEKDVYCTYWISKIWLSLQLRKGTKKVNIVVDELYQVPACQEFIRSKLSQMAKYHAKMIISCHYLEQISIIRDELKAANSSYVLISGADKDNYKELKDELQPFQVEDLLCLKRYHALNLFKIGDGYSAFVTKLPPK